MRLRKVSLSAALAMLVLLVLTVFAPNAMLDYRGDVILVIDIPASQPGGFNRTVDLDPGTYQIWVGTAGSVDLSTNQTFDQESQIYFGRSYRGRQYVPHEMFEVEEAAEIWISSPGHHWLLLESVERDISLDLIKSVEEVTDHITVVAMGAILGMLVVFLPSRTPMARVTVVTTALFTSLIGVGVIYESYVHGCGFFLICLRTLWPVLATAIAAPISYWLWSRALEWPAQEWVVMFERDTETLALVENE